MSLLVRKTFSNISDNLRLSPFTCRKMMEFGPVTAIKSRRCRILPEISNMLLPLMFFESLFFLPDIHDLVQRCCNLSNIFIG